MIKLTLLFKFSTVKTDEQIKPVKIFYELIDI